MKSLWLRLLGVLILAIVAAALFAGGRWWLLVYAGVGVLLLATLIVEARGYRQRRSANRSVKPS